MSGGTGRIQVEQRTGGRPDGTKAATPSGATRGLRDSQQKSGKRADDSAPPCVSVSALFDVGWGRALYIRGDGPGLSWQKGNLMHNAAPDRWEWATDGTADAFEYKLLIDDREWSMGDNFRALPGGRNEVEPDFGGPVACGGRITLDNWQVPGCGIKLVRIVPGRFTMGERGAPDEVMHTVTLTESYWIGKYQLTQGQWHTLMGHNPSKFHYMGGNAPVENISWYEAMEFCRKLTERERAAGRLPEGYVYSLPTEAQWEYAYRAGHVDMSGESSALELSGWFRDNSGGRTHPVGGKHANTWGLHDMLGNVCEWCWDWYGVLDGAEAVDPVGPPIRQRTRIPMAAEDITSREGEYVNALGLGESVQLGKVCRGGSWQCHAGVCSSSARCHMDPKCRFASVGFRIALRRVRS